MPIPVALAVPIFLTIWFVTLFAILPIGARSQSEAGTYVAGTDPGAPVNPRLLYKAFLTTLIAIVIFALLMLAMRLAGWTTT